MFMLIKLPGKLAAFYQHFVQFTHNLEEISLQCSSYRPWEQRIERWHTEFGIFGFSRLGLESMLNH